MPRSGCIQRKVYFRDPRLAVVITREKSQSAMPLHRHEFLEIAVVLGGSGLHRTPRGVRRILAGDVLVVNTSQSHGYESTRGLELANILVGEDVLREVEKELGTMPGYHALFTLEPVRRSNRNRGGGDGHLRIPRAEMAWVEGIVASMEAENSRLEAGGALMARAWLQLLLGYLARRYKNHPDGDSQLDARIGNVLSQIDRTPEIPVTVQDLARNAGMSERSFLRSFKEATGQSPIDYVLRSRIRKAERLLLGTFTRATITEIAFSCGFNDSNYFSRIFRRFAHCSPRAFRASRSFPRE